MDRRNFLSESVLASVALALCACGSDTAAPPEPPPSGMRVDLNQFAELRAVGGIAITTVAAYRLAIVRTGQSSYVALSRICPHQGGTINLTGGRFVCSRHGATFDTNGTWVGGQRTTNMTVLNTTFDASTNTLTIL